MAGKRGRSCKNDQVLKAYKTPQKRQKKSIDRSYRSHSNGTEPHVQSAEAATETVTISTIGESTPNRNAYANLKNAKESTCNDINLSTEMRNPNAPSFVGQALELESMQKDVSVSKNKTLWNSTKIKLSHKNDTDDIRLCTEPGKTPDSQKCVQQNARISTYLPETKTTKFTRSGSNRLSRDMKLQKILSKFNGLQDGTELAYYSQKKRLLKGYKKEEGICCSCCQQVISCGQFEVHATRKSTRNPYKNIFLSNGLSLCSAALFVKGANDTESSDEVEICLTCSSGGNLIFCDGCGIGFHRGCAKFQTASKGGKYCSYCQHYSLTGGDIERNNGSPQSIGNNCTSFTKASEKTIGGCVLCRSDQFDNSGFDDLTVLICDQCEREFHVGCLREYGLGNLQALPEGEWFCCNHCRHIYSCLDDLVEKKFFKIPKVLVDMIESKHVAKSLKWDKNTDITFRLLHPSRVDADGKMLLSQAQSILTECFDPIIDPQSGQDIIHAMVSSTPERDFHGMYCGVLIANSVVVSAGIFRIFGAQAAEIPLVGTHPEHRKKGYFQAFLACIEKLLSVLAVQNLVLPATKQAEPIWIRKFGFSKMSKDKFDDYMKDIQITSFEGNTILEKPLSRFGLDNISYIQDE